jgi:hypothetical protein
MIFQTFKICAFDPWGSGSCGMVRGRLLPALAAIFYLLPVRQLLQDYSIESGHMTGMFGIARSELWSKFGWAQNDAVHMGLPTESSRRFLTLFCSALLSIIIYRLSLMHSLQHCLSKKFHTTRLWPSSSVLILVVQKLPYSLVLFFVWSHIRTGVSVTCVNIA